MNSDFKKTAIVYEQSPINLYFNEHALCLIDNGFAAAFYQDNRNYSPFQWALYVVSKSRLTHFHPTFNIKQSNLFVSSTNLTHQESIDIYQKNAQELSELLLAGRSTIEPTVHELLQTLIESNFSRIQLPTNKNLQGEFIFLHHPVARSLVEYLVKR
jgi:hypothetical protein